MSTSAGNRDYYQRNPEAYKRQLARIRKWHANDRVLRPERTIMHAAKARAKRKGLPFDLEMTDILIPMYCPILGLKLERGVKVQHDASPVLDRMIPALGYVKGNVQVICQRANRIKNDATPDELETIALYVRKTVGPPS